MPPGRREGSGGTGSGHAGTESGNGHPGPSTSASNVNTSSSANIRTSMRQGVAMSPTYAKAILSILGEDPQIIR